MAATGHGFGSKPRPVVIIQADAYLGAGPILTVGVTGRLDMGVPLRPRVTPSPSNGLKKASDIMIDVILPVRPNQFGRYIGVLDMPDLASIDRALLTLLGISVA